jgi:hypothetical protein
VNTEKHRRPNMTPPELISHLLNRFYFLLKEEELNPFLIKHNIDEIAAILQITEGIGLEAVILKAIETTPDVVKKREFYINELKRMAKIAEEIINS